MGTMVHTFTIGDNMEMKTYIFWVTLPGKAAMKVSEEGRTSFEAKDIVESRFPTATVMLAETF